MEHQAPSRRSKLNSRSQARAARASPTQDLTLAGGQVLLEKPKLSKWSLRRFRLGVLKELGQAKGITLDPHCKSQKQDWIDALLSDHRSRHPTPDLELRSRVADNHGPEEIPASYPGAEMQAEPSEYEETMSTFMEVDRVVSSPASSRPLLNAAAPGSYQRGERPCERIFIVKLYDRPDAWHPVKEVVYRSANGDVSLSQLHTQLECQSDIEVQILDPKRYRPFYNYQPDLVLAADLESLAENGQIRVICMKKKNRR